MCVVQARLTPQYAYAFLSKGNDGSRHDRDTKYTISFRAIIESGQVKTLPLPARSPNLNAYAERWVRSVKEECLSKIILFGERSFGRALNEYVTHYHAERNHQGKSNVLLFRRVTQTRLEEPVRRDQPS
jgi:putative transposase